MIERATEELEHDTPPAPDMIQGRFWRDPSEFFSTKELGRRVYRFPSSTRNWGTSSHDSSSARGWTRRPSNPIAIVFAPPKWYELSRWMTASVIVLLFDGTGCSLHVSRRRQPVSEVRCDAMLERSQLIGVNKLRR